ncbi:hypothetical protein PsYK624_165680 [Phanerochaete sordida]|uniref:Uncharacterized protein n=1 Tax=Phanerochaete sordida TaxID=48140 RepID=A0A9P3GSH7_9APHY|nr:hypothetical protein PsYK624_165680 [Phanerochaete sordida]
MRHPLGVFPHPPHTFPQAPRRPNPVGIPRRLSSLPTRSLGTNYAREFPNKWLRWPSLSYATKSQAVRRRLLGKAGDIFPLQAPWLC